MSGNPASASEFNAIESIMKYTGRTKSTQYNLKELHETWKAAGGALSTTSKCRYPALCSEPKDYNVLEGLMGEELRKQRIDQVSEFVM